MILTPAKVVPTPIEATILDIYCGGSRTSYEVAELLQIDPSIVYTITNRWMLGRFNYTPKKRIEQQQPTKETTMAKNTEKNKAERDKLLTSLRKGGTEYSIDMDKVRGILGELAQGEALICQKTGLGSDVVLRLGDVSYK
jgi:hypothetical protein